MHDEGHSHLERVEFATDRLPHLLLVHLRFWNKGAALPFVCALVAWPQNALFVLSLAWLCGNFNKRDPRPLELIHRNAAIFLSFGGYQVPEMARGGWLAKK